MVALAQLVAAAVADQDDAALLDERRLAAAGLMDRRVIRRPGRSARSERVPGELGALSGLGRGEDLEPVAAARVAAAAAVGGAHDGDGSLLVEAQQLRETKVQSRGDPARNGEGRTGLAALDLRKHGRAHPAALREIPERQSLGFAQRLDARSDHRGSQRVGALGAHLLTCLRHTRVRYHGQAYGGRPPRIAA